MLKNLLFYRLIVFNLVASALVVWGLATGYVQMLFAGDTTGLPYVMSLVFIVGLVSTFMRAKRVSTGLNVVKDGGLFDTSKLAIKNGHIGFIGSSLVTLGLLGNILGFVVVVSNMDISGGSDAMMKSILAMMGGMKIAFYNTFVGTALGLWTLTNYQILKTATSLLEQDAEMVVRQEYANASV